MTVKYFKDMSLYSHGETEKVSEKCSRKFVIRCTSKIYGAFLSLCQHEEAMDNKHNSEHEILDSHGGEDIDVDLFGL
jgi:hypothetical protein